MSLHFTMTYLPKVGMISGVDITSLVRVSMFALSSHTVFYSRNYMRSNFLLKVYISSTFLINS